MSNTDNKSWQKSKSEQRGVLLPQKSHLEKQKQTSSNGGWESCYCFPGSLSFWSSPERRVGEHVHVCVCAGLRMGPGTSKQGNFQGADSVLLSLAMSKRVSDGKQCQLVVTAPPCTSPVLKECSRRRSSLLLSAQGCGWLTGDLGKRQNWSCSRVFIACFTEAGCSSRHVAWILRVSHHATGQISVCLDRDRGTTCPLQALWKALEYS